MDTVATGLTIGVVVAGLTQVAKWSNFPAQRAPLLVLALSLILTAVYAWSSGQLTREMAWPLLGQAVEAALVAAGIYGYVRGGPESVTATKSPPPGAGTG